MTLVPSGLACRSGRASLLVAGVGEGELLGPCELEVELPFANSLCDLVGQRAPKLSDKTAIAVKLRSE